MRSGELAQWLGASLEGDAGRELTGVAAVEAAGPSQVAFAAGRKAEELAAASGAGCLLVASSFENASGRTVIRVSDPRSAFARVISRFHPPRKPEPGVHPTAVVAPDASIGGGTSVGPHCFVGAGVRVGKDCVLHSHVSIYEGCELGDRVMLHSGAVIGADGFGFVLAGDHYEKFPQVGRVRIGSDVEIGANSCVDRAALGVTEIGDGTKLDNMVHVGHNCRVGRHVVIAAQTGLSGGVVIEDYAVVGGQVGVGDKARIRSGAVVGSGAGILTSKIVAAGEPVWGTPARPLREHLSQLAHLARLPKLKSAVDDLVRRVAELEKAVPGPEKEGR
jgi:UDP-3-O-[3-hydroxymyristoyl] glucosamine N-acyltransferase